MKRKENTLQFIIIFAAILALMSIPKATKERLGGITVATISPLWERIVDVQLYFASSTVTISDNDEAESENTSELVQQLQIENQALKNEISKLQELFEHELTLISQLTASPYEDLYDLNDDAIQHREEHLKILGMELKGIPARVIFRSHSTWSSSLWINVGQANNEEVNRGVIEKNSPVLVGKSIVGVIDYVGRHQSRVRLITDSGLTPSVRVSRGEPQNKLLRESLHTLAGYLSTRNDLFETPQDKNTFVRNLEKLKSKAGLHEETWLLAKGELQGRSHPLWRSPGQSLKGIGFNYDYPDNEGPARDLRSGKPVNAPESIPQMSIVKENDLLVTTGLDGVFPQGLHVAEVSKIHLLREGDYFYELEAKPTAGDLDELSLVYVLPPVGFSTADQPPIIGR